MVKYCPNTMLPGPWSLGRTGRRPAAAITSLIGSQVDSAWNIYRIVGRYIIDHCHSIFSAGPICILPKLGDLSISTFTRNVVEFHHTEHSRSPKIKGEMFSPSNISVGSWTISITVSVFVLELELSPGAAPAAGAAPHHEGSLVVEVKGHGLASGR